MVIGYKIMSDSAYGTGTRWSYGQSPQHSPPHPVVGGCSPPSPCDAKVTVSVGRNDGPLMGTAVAGRVGSRVDMDPDTARQHNPGTLSCSCFAPCVSTHRKHKKRFSFSFFFLLGHQLLSARLADTLPHHLLARAVNFSIAPVRLLIQCVRLCCWAVLCARHVRPTLRVFSVSTASTRRTTARRETYTPESQSKNLRQDAQPSVRRGILLLLDSAAPSVTAHEFNRFF
jgi:hypothetical protein